MKKRVLCFVVAVAMLLVAFPAFADTTSAIYYGYCYRAFTPSAELSKDSNSTPWSLITVRCTTNTYTNTTPATDPKCHKLKIYNATGGAAAENKTIVLNSASDPNDYNEIYLYTGQKYTPSITFKVYNYFYFQNGDSTHQMYTYANVYGYLGS